MNHFKLLFAMGSLLAFSMSASAALFTSGHGDLGVGYEDEGSGLELHPHWHLGGNAVVDGSPLGTEDEFEAGDITAQVSSTILVPNNPALNTGTGVSAGSPLWFLPQGNTPGVPFLGIATEELDPGAWGDITFALGTVTSPSGSGHFSLWQTDSFGAPTFFWSTNDPTGTVNGDNTLVVAPGGHDHYNYGFSELGTWSVELTISGTHNVDGFQQSEPATFSFSVVPEPGSAMLCALGAFGLVLRRRRA